MRKRHALPHVFASALLVIAPGCGDRTPAQEAGASAAPVASTAPVASAEPEAPPYPELPWPDVAKRIESGEVVWIIQAQERRVFLTTKSDEEHVTTAPTDSALSELLARADPKKQKIVVAEVYSKHKEVLWRDLPAVLSKGMVLDVQQNGGRRVLIDMLDENENPTRFYITIQPRYDDITKLVPKKYPIGLSVRFHNVREIGWRAAMERIATGGISGVFLGHGDRVYLHTSDGRDFFTIDPEPNATSHWLRTYRPDFQSITVE